MSDEQVASIVQRVQRLQEEKRTIEDDIREVYQEARANGYDVKVLRAVVKHLGKDENEVAEFDAVFELYLQAFRDAVAPSRDAGRATPARANTVPTYPERVSRPAPVDQPAPFLPARDPQSGFKGSDPEGVAGGESPSSIAASEQVSVDVPQARNEPGSGVVASGGGGVTASPETRPAFTLPLAKPLRPHCQNPDRCGSYGSKHCDACIRAAGLTEALAYG